MSLEKLKEEGLKWIEANKSKRFSGVRKLLTDLYPDNAHFIYELLQNSEDTEASIVRFTLTNDNLDFEHNGKRLFSLADVESITGIGDSTKNDDPTSIGKFGVGFKAVFAYTNTPEIHSGAFHFRIHDLVVPETNGVNQQRLREQETRFIFPFNNPNKTSEQAVVEIEQGLRALGDNTLLFLKYIRKIEYLLPDGSLGSLERIDQEDGHIEIRASHPGGNDTVSHWLRFQKDIEVVEEDKSKICRVAIAYSLIEEEDKKKRRSTWKIVPLDHGQVSIYFPAEKETSNLRFHLHAPFASTFARDSVRDCKANHQLRDHLADLVVESLASIRDQCMLTVGYLAVLPNPEDNLATFYEPIREAIVHAFKNELLTPTKSGVHAKADGLYRGPARIAEILNDDDLSLLTNYDPPLWAANPPQQNQREDRFLDSLDIDKWGWSELAHAVSWIDDDAQERIENWIAQKDDAWLIRFYALLGEACDTHHEIVRVGNVRIVRSEVNQDLQHIIPGEAFFPPDEGKALPPDIRFVKPTVYSTGGSEAQKKSAMSFLKRIGVRPFDAKAMTELRLGHYKSPSPPEKVGDNYFKDLKQFIAYWKENTTEASLFSKHTFLIGISHDGHLRWRKPEELCLDKPYLETNLAELTKIHGKDVIWDGYQDKMSDSQLKDFVDFLQATGVMMELRVEKTPLHENPNRGYLWEGSYGKRSSVYAISEDYSIVGLVIFLGRQSVACSRLIWEALIRAESKVAKACYRANSRYDIKRADSKLIHHLKIHDWIPNKKGEFCNPKDMTKDDLRTDFPYDDRNGLLTAIGFGENAKMRSNEYSLRNHNAQNMGFESADEAEKMAQVAQLIKEIGMSPDILLEQYRPSSGQKQPSFPSRPVANPERRQERLGEQLSDAPDKEYEKRERSVRTTNGAIDPSLWLKERYTNDTSQMVCQICKEEMPFRKRDGEYYFEAVESFSKDHLPKEHEAQFLALCPLCAAKYKEFIKKDAGAMEDLRNAILVTTEPEVSVRFGDSETTIRFVEVHLNDLRVVLNSA